jgi:cell pole-organizing protein PopZ
MSQPAKVQEPSMEEILASIRHIIADEDSDKTAKPPEPAAAAPPSRPAPAPPPPAPPAPPAAAVNDQSDIDAMLADLEVAGLAEPEVEPEPEPKPEPKSEQVAAAPPPAHVLDLSEANMAQTPQLEQAPSFRTIDSSSDVVFADRAPEPPPRAVEEAPQPRLAAPEPERALISNATAAAMDSAFNTLAHTVLGQNARTLEDLVKEMLRPLLKSWLDDNLPSLVERIVRTEIERVSRGKP